MKHAGFAAALAATLQEERRIGPPEPRDAKSARHIPPPEEPRKEPDDPLATAISTLCGRMDAVERQTDTISDLARVVSGACERVDSLREDMGAWQEALDDQAHHTHNELHDPQVVRSLLDLNERLRRLEKQVAFMASAQAMQERQILLHTRATAADLAIKGAVPGDLAMQTAMADAWLAWLNAGVT